MPLRLIPLIVLALMPATILAQDNPARVDQAGDPLPPGAVARLGTVRLRHPDWIRSLAVSPDGKTLASGGDSHIRLWEMPSGRPLKVFRNYRDAAESGYEKASAVAFTAKGELVALGYQGEGSVLYDPALGKELKRLKGYSIDVFSAGGQLAVLASGERCAVWDVTTGMEVREVPSPRWAGGPLPATLSADGKTLAICEMGRIRRVDTGTGKMLPWIRHNRGTLSAVALSPDGKTLAAANVRSAAGAASPQEIESNIILWDADSGKEVRTLKSYNRFVIPLAFSADGKILAAGLGDMTYAGGKTLVLLETATGKELDRTTGHDTTVRAVAFVAGTNTIVSACEHGMLRTWDATNGKQLREVQLPRRFIYPTLSPDGKIIAWGEGGRIYLRDAAADSEIRRLELKDGVDLLFSDDAKYLVAWGGRECRVWETSAGQELIPCRTRGLRAVAFSPDGKFMARFVSANPADTHIEIVELPTGKELRQFNAKYDVGALAVSPDGKFLASGQRDQTITLWDLSKGESLWLAKHPARDRGPRTTISFACPIAFSPDGKLLASGGDDYTVRLWDVATGKELRKFVGHEDAVEAIAFSADGKTLASASADTTVLIWEITRK